MVKEKKVLPVKPTASVLRSGTVAIVGRPNVGKSTLLNQIIGEKVTIVSKVPQTTRHSIRGIYSDERGQIVFIDTPGILKGKDRLGRILNRSSLDMVDQVDCLIHLVDSSEPVGLEEKHIVEQLVKIKAPVILGLNKIDLKGKFVAEYIVLWEKALGKKINEVTSPVLLPLSGKKGNNVPELLDMLFKFLPAGEPLYPTDTISDMPQKMFVADIIREKLLEESRQELPHSVAVIVEKMEPRKNKLLYVLAAIIVERDSQKEIVIGRGGALLKKVGTLARQELENIMEKRVFLELNVLLKRSWREDPEILHELGYET